MIKDLINNVEVIFNLILIFLLISKVEFVMVFIILKNIESIVVNFIINEIVYFVDLLNWLLSVVKIGVYIFFDLLLYCVKLLRINVKIV